MLVVAAVIGLVIGFLGGAFGKGGSAIATPMLHAAGFPPLVALASPLPATVPSTLVASWAYWRERLIDWRVVGWSIAIGFPATVAGAVATRWIGGDLLVKATDVILIGLGVRFALQRKEPTRHGDRPRTSLPRLVAVAAVVGLASGLLANSGGFLLAPLFIAALNLPIKTAFACSLAIASALAVPGTVVHAALGHIDWTLVAVFSVTAVPFSFLGARMAMRTESGRLERIYGVVIAALGLVFLITG
ncbi:MAG: sulfite exporter TauE/SafE family protein [Acidimicrobiales bacterium]